ncbi:MAG: phosphatidylserine decarboxylase [Burkholderiaceae bacterium]
MNRMYPHPLIAREGWPFLAGAALLAGVVHLFGGIAWSWPFWALALFVLQFFRDPARDVPSDPLAVLCPADGRVIKVERARDPILERDSLKISVFMNVFNVHSNRSPVDGIIERVAYFPGRFFNADLDKASEANERNALVIRRPDGEQITCIQVAGLIARRILCYVSEGDAVHRGQRFGFIRFGSRVDLYLPLQARPQVAIGEKVQASSMVVASLPPVLHAPAGEGTDTTGGGVAA